MARPGSFAGMRILVLNYEFPPVGGGGGSFSEGLCRTLAAMGHEIRVQTVHFRGLPKTEVKSGYTIYRSRSGRTRSHTCSVPEMATFLVAALLPSLRMARAWKPDAIHVHFAVPTGVLGWLLHRLTGIPYALSVQLGDVPGGVPDQTERLFRWIKPFTVPIWNDAAAVTAPSGHIRQLALRSYRVPIEVVPNGVDTSNIKQSPGYPHHPVRLVFAGRFNPQKNLLFLLRVLEKTKDLSWEMDLFGDGPLMGDLRAAADSAHLTRRIHFHGWVSPDRVDAAFGVSDILFLPSLSEGLPVVGVRALAAGLAILGSDIGGISDLVRSGTNGLLCPAGDGQGFEAALRDMIQSRDRLVLMKKESRKLAGNFSFAEIGLKMERILARVARSPRRG
jgi:glycosyltransferase involved in cell wall biosynthesis